MPRFQPGAHRYFGATARPTSSITASLLPGLRRSVGSSALRRPLRTAKPAPYTIGKTERLEITKKLLKMPNYVPRGTTKALKTFAQHVMADQKHYSKEERAFAAGTLHGERTIRDTEAQKKFIEGEVAALVDIKDRRVKDTFRFTHRAEEVAGQTLRGLVKEQRAKNEAPSVSEKRAGIRPRGSDDQAPAAVATPSWTAPVPLEGGAGQTDHEIPSGWPAPFAPAHHTPVTSDTVHAPVTGGMTGLTTGGSADVVIVSDRVSDAEVKDWATTVDLRLRRLPLATLPLLHAFPSLPPLLVIDSEKNLDLSGLKLPAAVKRVAIFHDAGAELKTPAVPLMGQKEVIGQLDVVGLQSILVDAR